MHETPRPPHPSQAQGGPLDGAGTPAAKAGDATVAAADNPAERAGAAQVHTDVPEPAGRQPAERGAEGTDTPPTGSTGGTNSSVEREA